MLAFYMKSYLKFTLVAIPEGTGLSRLLFTLRKKKRRQPNQCGVV